MPFVASSCCRAAALCSLSSLTFAILSSRVSMLRGRGLATASKISWSSSASLISDAGGDSPVRALKASAAPPSPMVVSPLRELAGDRSVLIDESLFSVLSIPWARAALPSSHAAMSILRSTPMESYCDMRLGPISEMSLESSRALSDSSRSRWSLACRPRIPVDMELSLRTWERHRSLPGVRGSDGVGGKGNAEQSLEKDR